MQDDLPPQNKDAPFARSASLLRMIIGHVDAVELAKKAGIDPSKMTSALEGKVGLESEEIKRISTGFRAQELMRATAYDHRHKNLGGST